MYDSIVADLRCPVCRILQPGSELQTLISRAPAYRVLRVGDLIELVAELPRDVYLPIGQGPSGVSILEPYDCMHCPARRWARSEVQGARLAVVEAVPFTEEVLAATDFISDDLCPDLTETDRQKLAAPEARERLREDLVRKHDEIETRRSRRSS